MASRLASVTTRFALVAGGGTGGHLVPALAVARTLAEGRAPGEVELIGSRRGIDATLVAEAGLPVTLLPGRGIARRTDPRSLVANLAALAGLAWAAVRALAIVARRRPAVVVAMGGYASVPVALAALLWRVPVVVVNVDAVPGAANRLVGRFAAASAVAFPGTTLRGAVVTGAPVRPDVVAAARPGSAERAKARASLAMGEHQAVVGVVGGSLGAHRLNEAALSLAAIWAERPDIVLHHVVGRRDFAWAESARPAPGALDYRQIAFEDRMDLLYQAADVMVCRAGANTVAELAVVGVPSVLVPLPGAPGDHQTANARALVDAGAAVLIPDEQCTGERLAGELDALVGDGDRRRAMAEAAARLGRPDALQAVVAVVEAHAAPRSREPNVR